MAISNHYGNRNSCFVPKLAKKQKGLQSESGKGASLVCTSIKYIIRSQRDSCHKHSPVISVTVGRRCAGWFTPATSLRHVWAQIKWPPWIIAPQQCLDSTINNSLFLLPLILQRCVSLSLSCWLGVFRIISHP